MTKVSSLNNINNQKILFAPIKGKRNFEEVSDGIKKLIFKGILKPGDKLPSENEMSSQFGVGRQTVREALRLLEISGFITIRKGIAGGPIIVDTISSTLSNSLLDAIQIRKISIDEITVARIEIESIILNHLFKNLEDLDIETLKNNIIRAKKKIEEGIQPFDENIQFHILLAKASKNHIFVIISEAIMAVVSDFLSRFEQCLKHSGNITKVHEEILNAIIEKKREKAVSLLQTDLVGVKNRIKALIGRNKSSNT